jgi:hypothetical protein
MVKISIWKLVTIVLYLLFWLYVCLLTLWSIIDLFYTILSSMYFIILNFLAFRYRFYLLLFTVSFLLFDAIILPWIPCVLEFICFDIGCLLITKLQRFLSLRFSNYWCRLSIFHIYSIVYHFFAGLLLLRFDVVVLLNPRCRLFIIFIRSSWLIIVRSLVVCCVLPVFRLGCRLCLIIRVTSMQLLIHEYKLHALHPLVKFTYESRNT